AQLPRRWKQRWKRRRVEKSPNRLSPPAWKSRQRRGIPTFPPLRRLRVYEQKPKPKNRTFHLLQKADIFTCYEHRAINTKPRSGESGFHHARPVYARVNGSTLGLSWPLLPVPESQLPWQSRAQSPPC